MPMTDIVTLANGLRDWIKNQGKANSNRDGLWKWLSGLMVSAIAMLTIGMMYWRARKQGKQLAKLLHERDLAEEIVNRGKVLDFVSRNEIEAEKRRATTKEAKIVIDEIDKTIMEIKNNATKTKTDIQNLKNWRDFDNFVTANNS